MIKDAYSVRPAKPEELELLPAIEQAAGEMFLKTRYAEIAVADNSSENIDLTREMVWVAVELETGVPVGFAIAYRAEESVHLHELDVHPDHGRRGIGRRLIEAVTAWARRQSAVSLTLTTFADVPWNGPFYARSGFRALTPGSLTPTLRAVLQAEAAAGFPMENRICMELKI